MENRKPAKVAIARTTKKHRSPERVLQLVSEALSFLGGMEAFVKAGQIGLSKALGNVFPVGLFDLNRAPRPVAQAYKYLIEMFKDEPLLAGTETLELS